MRSPPRSVILSGVVATALVSVLGLAGMLDSAEAWTQDERFKRARLTPVPLSDEIKLVAIDDAALDNRRLGRWPWKRELLAQAFDEIARAGARTVAVDILFSEAQNAEQDGRLAQSIGASPTVLAVNMDEGRLDPELWLKADGGEALSRLVSSTVEDITADPPTIATKAQLKGLRRARFLERPTAFKRVAAWKELLRLKGTEQAPADEAAFISGLTRGDMALGEFPERELVAEVFDRDRSFMILSKMMARGTDEGSPLDVPPLPVLAERAAGVGFVNSKADRDGQYRRVRPFWGTPYGTLPQIGLAAAMLHRGIAPSSVTVEGGWLRFPGGERLPLEDGRIYVDWPTSMFEPVAAAGDKEVLGGGKGVVAIARLVELARAREKLHALEERYRALGRDISALQGIPAAAMDRVPVDEPTRAAVKEQGEFLVGDLKVAGTADLKGLSDEERRIAGLYREWWRVDQDIPRARSVVETASNEVRDELHGKLVFVGFMATGVMADMINTPFGPRTPGVYFHAAVADMVLTGREVRFWPDWTGPAVALAMGLSSALVAWRVGAGLSTSMTVLLAGAWTIVAGAWAYAQFGWMLPVAVPVIAAAASQAASVSAAAVVHQRERARITRQFRARVSPELVDRLANDPDAVSMRGTQRTVTVLFGDLAGFTTISEKLGSQAVVETLNLNMSAMARELTIRKAYVNKFLGDGIMAFWSAFGEEPAQAQLAIEACRECQRAVNAITARPERAALPPVSLRLGVATGLVTVGDCGAPPELNDYTVIGDGVNLSARLESANKQFGTAILFDGATYQALTRREGLPIVPLGRVVVVGQSVPIELYTLLVEDPPEGWVESLSAAVEAFARADFEACEAAWAAHERRFGATKIAKPFREAMHDPEDRRDGVLRLRAK